MTKHDQSKSVTELAPEGCSTVNKKLVLPEWCSVLQDSGTIFLATKHELYQKQNNSSNPQQYSSLGYSLFLFKLSSY